MSNIRKTKDVVCVLNPDQIYQMQRFDGVDTSDFVTPYQMDAFEEDGIQIPEIKENSIYTFIPYQNRYIHLNEQTEDEIVLDRINKIETILSYLGAKQCTILSTSIVTNSEEKKLKGSVGIDTPTTDVNLKVSGTSRNRGSGSLSIESRGTWPGKYTIDGYEKAKKLAYEYGLSNDSTIQKLLEERNPAHPNVPELKEYHVDVRSDLEQLKTAALELKSKIKKAGVKFDLEGSYSSESEESRHNTYDFVAEFGPLELSQEDVSKYNKRQKQSNNNWIYWVMGSVIVALAVGLVISLL